MSTTPRIIFVASQLTTAAATSTSRDWLRAPTRSARSSRAAGRRPSPRRPAFLHGHGHGRSDHERPAFRQLPERHDQRHDVQRPDGNRQLLARRPGPARLDDQPAQRRGQDRRHHDDRRQRRLQLQQRRPGHLHGAGSAAEGLDPDRPGAARHIHRHDDQRLRIRAACSSATSSS